MARASSPEKRKNNEEENNLEDDRGENNDTNDTMIQPPDGGWGWVIVFASFMIHIVTDGVTYSFGIFYSAFLEYFNEGSAKTSWIASILVGVTLCSGPISSSFVNKYGCRPVTIVGAILASFCLVISFWAENVMTLYFTIGIGTGFGFGLIYLPAIVSVTCYFEKYRSLATGIAVCGSGLGTFIFAPLTNSLIDNYGWRGALMITGGLILHCIIFGALFRPLEAPKTKKIPLVTLSTATETEPLNGAWLNGTRPFLPNGSTSPPENINNNSNGIMRPRSVTNVGYVKYSGLKTEDDVKHNIRIALSQPMLVTKTSSEIAPRSFGSGIMHRRDVFYQGSLENVQTKSRSLDNSTENVRIYSSVRSLPNINSHKSGNFECLPYAEEKFSIVREMLDLSLLRDPVFIIFTLSNFCTSIGFNVPYVYLPEQAKEKGMDSSNASYLLAVVGLANTMGRIVLGYVSDKPWVNRLLVYNLCLTLCGFATALSTLCTSFTAFAIYSVTFGITAGAYVGLTSVVLVDLIGLERLTNAFGLLLLFQGFASLLGPPIVGLLHDTLHSYNPGFWLAGVMIAISGLMLFSIPSIQRYTERRRTKVQRIEVVT